MTRGKSRVERITELDWDGLRELWAEIKERNTPEWSPGKAFEHLVLQAFKLDGAEVRWPYEVRELGRLRTGRAFEEIDGAVRAQGLWCLVQSKDTQGAVNVEPIAMLRNQLLRRPSQAIGLVFSVNGFTEPALVLASFLAPQTVLLWDRDDIDYCLKNQQICAPLVEKYRVCIQEGRADHNLRVRVEEKP